MSVCGGGGSRAEPETEGQGRSAHSAPSHEEIISGWFADKIVKYEYLM